ncbi:hypothetical protein YB2330_004500 [Saitoella coloradoensis]
MDQIQKLIPKPMDGIRRNYQHFLEDYTVYDYIRIITIIGAYCLLRPYLLKIGAKIQEKDHERAMAADEANSIAAVDNPHLRGEDSEDEAPRKWGAKQRKREKERVVPLREDSEDEDEVLLRQYTDTN